ncbi:ORF MSV125 hypothetical prtoein [Melanoplus sanguinipes entomopoxvirus]|uniref:ORF MSV125 hypothetical prtoein n=1 Tax=Melanoplus sanguinipes entomopoxvirus TaxID=83191 RepID=Q9YVW7_MSEPV|nr:ORF MSV125 hypothetical prtoein [Melanoplus sanguinipes entomopoxvirus]AAC97798.1 ORF MSV125 hypothetical prtoein [Melanoplus sanguinipes entomopoxvirus 'O']
MKMNYQGYFNSNLGFTFYLNGIYNTYMMHNNYVNENDVINDIDIPLFNKGNVFHRISNAEITNIINEFIKFTSKKDSLIENKKDYYIYNNKKIIKTFFTYDNVKLENEMDCDISINISDLDIFLYGFYIIDKDDNILEAIGIYI